MPSRKAALPKKSNNRVNKGLKPVKEAIARVAEEWQKTFDADLDAIWILDKDQRIIRCNRTAQKVFNLSRDEMIGKHCWEIAHCSNQPIPECPALRVKKSLCRESMELPIGGRWFAVYVDPIPDAGGRISGFVHIVSDITERKRAEQLLREGEERFSKAFKTSPYAYMIANMEDGRVIEVNDAFTVISGFTREEAIAGSTITLKMWANEEDRKRMVVSLHESGEVRRLETQLRSKNGGVMTVLLFARVIRLGNRPCIISIIEDITERKRAEAALRESEKNFRVLFDENPLPTILSEIPSEKITFVNRRMADLLGMDVNDVIGKTANELGMLKNSDDQEKLTGLIVGQGYVDNVEVERVSPDGTVGANLISMRLITVNGKPCCLSVLQDITERKRMEEVIQRTAKLDSLGILAGGIAHDFNNLLTGIYGYMDLARSASKDAQMTEYLEAMFATMKRAKALTLQLLTFSKGGFPIQKVTPLIPFIQETAQFALSGSNSSCRFLVDENLPPCNIDKNQIAQVIDNIVINAQQAMPGGGTVEITAQNLSFGENEHPSLDRGNYVKISIKDSGIGIPKESMPRIFDPFYTTKIKGHGLGLATCYSIVKRHGGCIDVESESGKGSTFHVYLPASMENIVVHTHAAVKHTGKGVIVVADDEEVVREAFRQMLESLGYTVVCKNDGKEAIEFYINETAENRRCAAMIFDLTIPGGMGGMDAVTEIRKMNKKLPVFVASGYADNFVMKSPVEYGFTASISKPFTIAELSEMLEKKV